MFINSVSNIIARTNNQILKHSATYGKYKNYNIKVENWYLNDNLIGKRFIVQNEKTLAFDEKTLACDNMFKKLNNYIINKLKVGKKFIEV